MGLVQMEGSICGSIIQIFCRFKIRPLLCTKWCKYYTSCLMPSMVGDFSVIIQGENIFRFTRNFYSWPSNQWEPDLIRIFTHDDEVQRRGRHWQVFDRVRNVLRLKSCETSKNILVSLKLTNAFENQPLWESSVVGRLLFMKIVTICMLKDLLVCRHWSAKSWYISIGQLWPGLAIFFP